MHVRVSAGFILGPWEQWQAVPYCAVFSNDGGNEGLGFHSGPLQECWGLVQRSQGTAGTRGEVKWHQQSVNIKNFHQWSFQGNLREPTFYARCTAEVWF